MKNNSFLLFMLLSVWIIGCRTHKVAQQSTSTFQKIKDTLYIERSNPVHDTLYITVPTIRTIRPECDSLCQQELQRTLAQLATAKQAGANSYGVYYDRYRQQLVLYQNLKEQYDTYRSHQEQMQTSLFKLQPVPYIPTWAKVLAGIGVLVIIYICYKITSLIKGKIK